MDDVLIIGGGPAGLSAAVYTERAGRHARILEALIPGGQIVNTEEIMNYPGISRISGYDFASGLQKQAEDLGAEISYEKAVHIEKRNNCFLVKTASGKELEAGAVILATGARARHLGLPREEELTGKGISYCATCDGMFFKGRDVAVDGGGNTALQDALYLSRICSRVFLIHRRDAFRGSSVYVDQLKKKENVSFILNSEVAEFLGKEKLEGIVIRNRVTGEEKKLPVAALFIAIGEVPDNGSFSEVADLDPAGYIAAGEDCRTRTPGLFTAGDCRTKTLRQLTTAAADGAVAATAACEYLNGGLI